MNPITRIIPAMAALSAIASCNRIEADSAGYGTVHIHFDSPAEYATRSNFVDEQDESAIMSFGVIIWDKAHPERIGIHIDINGKRTDTILPSGKDYFAVGFANFSIGNYMNLCSLDTDDNQYLFKYTMSLASPYYCSLNFENEGIAMVSTYGKHFHLEEGEDMDLCFQMDRTLAKIVISLDKSNLQNADVEIQSVAIKNCSSHFLPFYTDEGPYVDISKYNHTDGDSADEGQVQELNSGKEIALYTVENLQGYRQDETYMKYYCTFVEIQAEHSLLGSITYRCYVGDGTAGNCDVKRNCLYKIKIAPTDSAGGTSCWRAQF